MPNFVSVSFAVSNTYESYLWSTGSTTNTASTGCNGSGCNGLSISVTVTDSSGCSSSASMSATFDGFDDIPLTYSVHCPDTLIIAAPYPVTWHNLNSIGLPNPTPFATGDTLILKSAYTGTTIMAYAAGVGGDCGAKETFTIYPSSLSGTWGAGPINYIHASDTIFCEGSSINLSISFSCFICGWYFDGVTEAGVYTFGPQITQPGVYTLHFNSPYLNCNLTEDISIGMLPVEEPVMEVDTLADCTACCIMLHAAGDFTNYLWSTGDTGTEINVCEPGDYQVTVTNSNGCTASTSVTIDETATGSGYMPHAAPSISGFKAFSNNGKLELRYTLPISGLLQTEIYAISGQLLVSEVGELQAGTHQWESSNLSFPTGVYLAVLTFNGQFYRQKLVIYNN